MSIRHVSPLILALAVLAGLAAPAGAQRRDRSPDTDHDGRISLQEFLAQRGRIFERMDANKDGQITRDEVEAFKAKMDAVAAGATIRSGRERPTGGREIARFEALTAERPVTRAQWDALMTRRFQRLDITHTGYITLDQMRPGRAMANGAPAMTATPAPN